jgi:hypothetical protein
MSALGCGRGNSAIEWSRQQSWWALQSVSPRAWPKTQSTSAPKGQSAFLFCPRSRRMRTRNAIIWLERQDLLARSAVEHEIGRLHSPWCATA